MRKLVFSALALAGLVQSSGCIIGDDDPEGFFSLSWMVTLNGAASTCDDAQVAQVEVLVTLDGTTQGTADHFPCNNLSDTTFGLTPGFYSVQVNALDANDDAIALGAVETDWEIFDGETTDLGSYTLAITGGALPAIIDLTADYGNAGGENCTETAVGGSGVVQQQINVYDSGGAQCIVVAVTGTDDPDNATCEPRLCQESNVAQTIQLNAGDYDIELWGFKGAVGPDPVLCYQSITSITVTGDGAVDLVAPFAPDAADKAACNATKPVVATR